jgi:hypothetical protein
MPGGVGAGTGFMTSACRNDLVLKAKIMSLE